MFLPSTDHGRWILEPASQTIEFNEIPMTSQCCQKPSKWCLETSKDLQIEVPRGTWNHQNQQKVKNMKSNENHSIYYVFEGLGHQKSADFRIRNHQESCLQSKPTFWHLKTHKIAKSDSKVSSMGDPKSIKNRQKFPLGHPRVLLSAPLQQMTAKVMPKCLLRTSKCSKNGFSRPLKINKCVCNRAWS